jgi:hypothetical protein
VKKSADRPGADIFNMVTSLREPPNPSSPFLLQHCGDFVTYNIFRSATCCLLPVALVQDAVGHLETARFGVN